MGESLSLSLSLSLFLSLECPSIEKALIGVNPTFALQQGLQCFWKGSPLAKLWVSYHSLRVFDPVFLTVLCVFLLGPHVLDLCTTDAFEETNQLLPFVSDSFLLLLVRHLLLVAMHLLLIASCSYSSQEFDGTAEAHNLHR